MTTDRRLHLAEGNMFKHFADHDQPVIPEGAVGPLEFQTAAEIEAERLSSKKTSSAEPVFRTCRDVNSPEVAGHISRQLSEHQPVLVLGSEYRVE